jgi:hypothetical protein
MLTNKENPTILADFDMVVVIGAGLANSSSADISRLTAGIKSYQLL